MTEKCLEIAALVERILAAPRAGRRRLVALAGAPASGKSTLAAILASELTCMGCTTQVVPMDGFHLDNRILSQRGILDRKGAPDSFDVAGLEQLCRRLAGEKEIVFPLFDRDRDIAIAGAGLISVDCDTILVEGNYLLFDTPEWRPLAQHWDVAVRLDVPLEVLRQRLISRWIKHGFSVRDAAAKAEGNDLQNADAIERLKLDTPDQIILRNTKRKED